jgi:hypothetical protein
MDNMDGTTVTIRAAAILVWYIVIPAENEKG